ncbi:30S ribosomal protein S10 [Candidatus Haliotispira prima]|uniref:Small ribosomal subunit protein uS10 n=1 Tax=Candidatus Haliotispira prima TaxID=3034016 RepID=A0ABY8MID4_9SPIO|nr:30S ribosomal protein S10 [Candidatus Haliotispira prima]
MKDRVRVRLKSFDVRLIEQSVSSIVDTLAQHNVKVAGPIPLPTRIQKFTVNKSTFVNKKSREQFEMRTHKRLLDIINPTGTAMDALQRVELPAGVDVEIR